VKLDEKDWEYLKEQTLKWNDDNDSDWIIKHICNLLLHISYGGRLFDVTIYVV
jgi:hypothetical protein